MGEGVQQTTRSRGKPQGEGLDADVLAVQFAQGQKGGDGHRHADLHQLDVALQRGGKQLAAEQRSQRQAHQQQQDQPPGQRQALAAPRQQAPHDAAWRVAAVREG
ncbi:hypothetical protein D3C80_1592420 [compost metagenome]